MRTKGWQKVFKFTFVEYVKTKSFIVSTIIISVIIAAVCVLTNVLPATMMSGNSSSGDGAANTFTHFSSLIVSDKSGILTEEDMKLLEGFGKVSAAETETDGIIGKLSTSTENEALLLIDSQKNEDGTVAGYSVKAYYSPEADSDTVKQLTEFCSQTIQRRNLINLGVSPENYDQTQIYVDTSTIAAGSKELNIFSSMVNYVVPMVSSLLLFILIFAYGQVVAQSIATEKTSRVMELLLTSIRPLAVVIGKVLAMGLVCLLQFIFMGIVGVGSIAISAPFGIIGRISTIMSNPDAVSAILGGNAVAGISVSEAEIAKSATDFISGISPLSIVLIFVVFILGFLLYALIAALVGASVSRIEDLQAAMGPYSILGVLGMYLAYFPVIFNADSIEQGSATTNSMQIFSYYFPVSSPFALPGAIVLNTLSMTQTLIAVLILAAFVVLVAIIVSKVYEAIILHNGSRIKFNDIIAMAFRK